MTAKRHQPPSNSDIERFLSTQGPFVQANKVWMDFYAMYPNFLSKSSEHTKIRMLTQVFRDFGLRVFWVGRHGVVFVNPYVDKPEAIVA